MKLALNLDSIQSAAFGGSSRMPKNVGALINTVLPYVFGAAGIALLIYLILGGFQLMTSKGDPKAMQGGQAKITNALLGFVIIFVAFWVVQIVGQLLGLTSFAAIFGGSASPSGAR